MRFLAISVHRFFNTKLTHEKKLKEINLSNHRLMKGIGPSFLKRQEVEKWERWSWLFSNFGLIFLGCCGLELFIILCTNMLCKSCKNWEVHWRLHIINRGKCVSKTRKLQIFCTFWHHWFSLTNCKPKNVNPLVELVFMSITLFFEILIYESEPGIWQTYEFEDQKKNFPTIFFAIATCTKPGARNKHISAFLRYTL